MKKRFFVIETEGEYPKKVALDLFKDKTELVTESSVGFMATCQINIESREYNGKWYMNASAWKVDLEEPFNPLTTATPMPDNFPEDSDLPF